MDVIEMIEEEGEKVACIDLSVVKGNFVPGANDPCPVMGFSDIEMEDIASALGKQAS